jgi:heme-degrading monooxygenase HmoA
MFVAIAFHHPAPGCEQEYGAYMERVRAAVGEPPGLIRFECLREEGGDRLFGLSLWESRADFEAALPLIGSLADEHVPEWDAREDEVVLGVPLTAGG